VLEGIHTAQQVGFTDIRINAVSIAGISETEVVPLARFARQHQLELRFIEFMPLDAERKWGHEHVLAGHQVKQLIVSQVGTLSPAQRDDPHQPAVDYVYDDGGGRVGFINSVTEPFCESCNRLRITAEGKLRNCLFSTVEWDIRELIRVGASNEEIAQQIRECVVAKKAGHGIDSADFQRPERAMYQIGG
jgi:cyclic pyranopterin phosphate synthase